MSAKKKATKKRARSKSKPRPRRVRKGSFSAGEQASAAVAMIRHYDPAQLPASLHAAKVENNAAGRDNPIPRASTQAERILGRAHSLLSTFASLTKRASVVANRLGDPGADSASNNANAPSTDGRAGILGEVEDVFDRVCSEIDALDYVTAKIEGRI